MNQSKVSIKTLEQCIWLCSGVFFANPEESHIWVLLLLTWNIFFVFRFPGFVINFTWHQFHINYHRKRYSEVIHLIRCSLLDHSLSNVITLNVSHFLRIYFFLFFWIDKNLDRSCAKNYEMMVTRKSLNIDSN